MSKRSITDFFAPAASKKRRASISLSSDRPPSIHPSYPVPIRQLPEDLVFSSVPPPSSLTPDVIEESSPCSKSSSNETSPSTPSAKPNPPPETPPKPITSHLDLDLLYFKPFLHASLAHALHSFLRSSLPFYRVSYTINRGGTPTLVQTPRYTTLFGVDATSFFRGDGTLCDSASKQPVPPDRYAACRPRPVPACLQRLLAHAAGRTGCGFNIALVNYYAGGADSIAPHSDDESFLGANPAIASLSLGATRDFVLKHKTVPGERVVLPLAAGDMVLMRGSTQAKWLHSIPKRKGERRAVEDGRINVTFRRALTRGGTENYYHYNVGTGPVHFWDEVKREMVPSATNGAVEKRNG